MLGNLLKKQRNIESLEDLEELVLACRMVKTMKLSAIMFVLTYISHDVLGLKLDSMLITCSLASLLMLSVDCLFQKILKLRNIQEDEPSQEFKASIQDFLDIKIVKECDKVSLAFVLNANK